MGELRAGVDGCEVVVRLEEGAELAPDVREALAELAEAMYAERFVGVDTEVEGFAAGLTVGSLGLDATGPTAMGAQSCWGYDARGRGTCRWYSSDDPGDPIGTCNWFSVTK